MSIESAGGSDFSSAIDRIDATLTMRSGQIADPEVSSYTLALLRDPNEAGKKFGQEAAEVMMAVCGEEDVTAVESEIADLVYASLVVARSRRQPARLANVLAILVARNEGGG